MKTPLQTKNRAANELRAKADELRAKLVDPAVEMSKDEVETTVAGIQAFEQRAAAAAGFTADAEIERQGGDDGVRRANPESDDAAPDTKAYADEMAQIATDVKRHFGGPGGFILAYARRKEEALSPAQRAVAERLEKLHQRTIVSTTGDASKAEVLLPLQQVTEIFSVDNVVSGIAQIARRYPVAGQTLRIPYLVQGDGANTRPLAGIANVGIVGENGAFGAREVKFDQRVLHVQKWGAYSEIGDEALMDDMTGQLSPTLVSSVGGQVTNAMNEFMTIDGNGAAGQAGQPLGALNAANGSLLKIARKVANDIQIEDVFAMYASFTMTGNRSARWLINRTALPKLLALKLNGNTLVTFLPSLQGAPVMTLLGIQIEVTDLLAVLGSESDFALVNGEFYAMAVRQELTMESSIHYKFQNGVTAYRFYARGGGLAIPTGTYAYKANAGVKIAEHSPFVTLDDVVAV